MAIGKSKAEELGFVGKEIYNKDILAAIKEGKLKYIMASVTKTNTGATSYLSFLNSMAGSPEVLTEEMLKAKAIRRSKLKPFMVTEKEKLIGQEAQKSLKEGKIINEKDIGAKVLVKRNDVVLAVYRTDRMQITAKAIAQQDGAYGDRIELQNMKTHKVLTGVVQDASTVVIDQ